MPQSALKRPEALGGVSLGEGVAQIMSAVMVLNLSLFVELSNPAAEAHLYLVGRKSGKR
jgi:hypothetical protein